LRALDNTTGQRVKCPKCGESFAVAATTNPTVNPVSWYRTSIGIAGIFIGLAVLIGGMIIFSLGLHTRNESARAQAEERARLDAEKANQAAESQAKEEQRRQEEAAIANRQREKAAAEESEKLKQEAAAKAAKQEAERLAAKQLEEKEREEARKYGSRSDADDFAQQFVKRLLRYPDKAEFSWLGMDRDCEHDKDHWICMGSVKTTNSFGVTENMKYTVSLQYHENNWYEIRTVLKNEGGQVVATKGDGQWKTFNQARGISAIPPEQLAVIQQQVVSPTAQTIIMYTPQRIIDRLRQEAEEKRSTNPALAKRNLIAIERSEIMNRLSASERDLIRLLFDKEENWKRINTFRGALPISPAMGGDPFAISASRNQIKKQTTKETELRKTMSVEEQRRAERVVDLWIALQGAATRTNGWRVKVERHADWDAARKPYELKAAENNKTANSPEEAARKKLDLAKVLIKDGKDDAAKFRLQQIQKDFPGTKAASEAGKLLEELGP